MQVVLSFTGFSQTVKGFNTMRFIGSKSVLISGLALMVLAN
jgi:hypothetical protein